MIAPRIWAYWSIIGEMHCDKSCQGRTRRRWAKASTLRCKVPALERRNLPHCIGAGGDAWPCRRLAPLLGLANGPMRGESEGLVRWWLDSLAGSVSLHQCFFLLSNKFPCFQPSNLHPSKCQPFSISAKSRAIAGYLCQRVSCSRSENSLSSPKTVFQPRDERAWRFLIQPMGFQKKRSTRRLHMLEKFSAHEVTWTTR